MRLTKKDHIYLIWMNRNASYHYSYLRVSQNKRTCFCVFLYWNQIGSMWNLLKPERNIHSACTFSLLSSTPSIAKTEIQFVQNGWKFCLLRQIHILDPTDLLLKNHKSGQDHSGDCVTLSPPYHLRACHFLVNFPSLLRNILYFFRGQGQIGSAPMSSHGGKTLFLCFWGGWVMANGYRFHGN